MSVIKDGDPFNATTVTGTVQTEVVLTGAQSPLSLAPQALSTPHLPGLLGADQTENFPSGYSRGWHDNASTFTFEDYDNYLVPAAGYQLFAPGAGAGDGFPYGPVGHVDGWRVLARGGLTTNALVEVRFGDSIKPSDASNPDTERMDDVDVNIDGIKVTGHVAVGDWAGYGGVTDYLAGYAFAVGWQDATGNWHCLERTVRHVSMTIAIYAPTAVFGYLTQADLDALGDGTVRNLGILVAVSPRGGGGAPLTDPLSAGNYAISARPFHARRIT